MNTLTSQQDILFILKKQKIPFAFNGGKVTLLYDEHFLVEDMELEIVDLNILNIFKHVTFRNVIIHKLVGKLRMMPKPTFSLQEYFEQPINGPNARQSSNIKEKLVWHYHRMNIFFYDCIILRFGDDVEFINKGDVVFERCKLPEDTLNLNIFTDVHNLKIRTNKLKKITGRINMNRDEPGTGFLLIEEPELETISPKVFSNMQIFGVGYSEKKLQRIRRQERQRNVKIPLFKRIFYLQNRNKNYPEEVSLAISGKYVSWEELLEFVQKTQENSRVKQ